MGTRQRQRESGRGPVSRAVIDYHNRHDGYNWHDEMATMRLTEAVTWWKRVEPVDEEEAA